MFIDDSTQQIGKTKVKSDNLKTAKVLLPDADVTKQVSYLMTNQTNNIPLCFAATGDAVDSGTGSSGCFQSSNGRRPALNFYSCQMSTRNRRIRRRQRRSRFAARRQTRQYNAFLVCCLSFQRLTPRQGRARCNVC